MRRTQSKIAEALPSTTGNALKRPLSMTRNCQLAPGRGIDEDVLFAAAPAAQRNGEPRLLRADSRENSTSLLRTAVTCACSERSRSARTPSQVSAATGGALPLARAATGPHRLSSESCEKNALRRVATRRHAACI